MAETLENISKIKIFSRNNKLKRTDNVMALWLKNVPFWPIFRPILFLRRCLFGYGQKGLARNDWPERHGSSAHLKLMQSYFWNVIFMRQFNRYLSCVILFINANIWAFSLRTTVYFWGFFCVRYANLINCVHISVSFFQYIIYCMQKRIQKCTRLRFAYGSS